MTTIDYSVQEMEKLRQPEEALENFKQEELVLSNQTDDWLAERRAQLKVEIALLKEKDDALKAERDEIDEEFTRRFSERGSTSTRTSHYTISLREDFNYPKVEDLTDFEDYVLRTKKLHLFQKRISSNAVKEELAIRQQEYNAFKKILDENQWNDDICKRVYIDLHQEDEELDFVLNRVCVLQTVGQLKSTVEEELKAHLELPGIGVITKQTINAVKRG